MNSIPLDLIKDINGDDYRDNDAASEYAFDKIKDFKSDLTGADFVRALSFEICRLKREKDGPRGQGWAPKGHIQWSRGKRVQH